MKTIHKRNRHNVIKMNKDPNKMLLGKYKTINRNKLVNNKQILSL